MVGIVDRCEHGGARDRCSMFALTLRRNSRRDQVELNARGSVICTINIQLRARSYDGGAANLYKVHARKF